MQSDFKFFDLLTSRPLWFRQCACRDCRVRRPAWQLPGAHRGVNLGRDWYCTPHCFEKAIYNQLDELPFISLRPPLHHRIPIGLLMLSRGELTQAQLNTALDAQRSSGKGKLGDWLRQLGFSTERQVTVALGLQWGSPVLSEATPLHSRWLASLPLRLEESFCMVPVHFLASTRTLHIAFGQEIAYPLLHAIERLLGCRTVPCLARESLVHAAIDQARSITRPDELFFETPASIAEMSRSIRSYALRVEATAVRMIRCGAFLWVRLNRLSSPFNLIFRAAVSSA